MVDVVQVGWARWDGDEFHDFRYFNPDERGRMWPIGFIPVWAKTDDADGSADQAPSTNAETI